MGNEATLRYSGKIHVRLRLEARGPLSTRTMSSTSPETVARRAGLAFDLPGVARTPFSNGVTAAPALEGWWTFELAPTPEPAPLGLGVAAEAVWEGIRRLSDDHAVEWAEPDVELTHPFPDDWVEPQAAALAPDRSWHLQTIGALEAHQRFTDWAPGEGVLAAHLDTGWTDHPAVPRGRFLHDGFNFWETGQTTARDPLTQFVLPILQPGHGTGTLCILAADLGAEYQGVALASRVLPIRISPSVIHIKTRSMAEGILAAVNSGAQVISISAGGLPSRLWAEAVNTAYANGVVIVAAAGNNFRLPIIRTPWKVMYPARFAPVIAVSGVTREEAPYWTENFFEMCGNHGPEVSVCAPTPGVSWAQPNAGYAAGAGTSTATPQVAGAVALWLSFHRRALESIQGPQRVEAVRHALLASAKDVGTQPYFGGAGGRTRNDWFGDGRVNVARMLDIAPVAGLPASAPARIEGGWFAGILSVNRSEPRWFSEVRAAWAEVTANAEGAALTQLQNSTHSQHRTEAPRG